MRLTRAHIRESPDDFVDSRRPIFKKAALAMKEEQETVALATTIEQEIRDHNMTPQDMLVEVRALMRTQKAEFERMRAENQTLHGRVSELEEVVRAIVTLPQLSQDKEFDFFASTVKHDAALAHAGQRTLLQLATREKDQLVVDYILRAPGCPHRSTSVATVTAART